MESELCHRCYWGYNVAHPLMLDKFQSLRDPTNALHIQNAHSPNEKGRRFFLGDQQLAFLLAFKRLINQFEQDLLKPPAASKAPENPYGRNRHTNCTTCPYYQSSKKEKKKKTDLYTCFKHLPKCKAVVNQVTAMCMLISILLCYRRVQEES